MNLRLLRGPSTRVSLIRLMMTLDPAGWERFCQVYRGRLSDFCRTGGFPEEMAEEISARVVARLYEDFVHERDLAWTSFRGHLSQLVRQEADRIRYERRRFYGYRLGFFWPGAKKSLAEWPVPPREFAEQVADDLSPRLQRLRSIIEKVRSNVTPETWDTFYRVEFLGSNYKQLAEETGMGETALRNRVFRVKRMIGEIAPETEAGHGTDDES